MEHAKRLRNVVQNSYGLFDRKSRPHVSFGLLLNLQKWRDYGFPRNQRGLWKGTI